jgi:hypothetical protein
MPCLSLPWIFPTKEAVELEPEILYRAAKVLGFTFNRLQTHREGW